MAVQRGRQVNDHGADTGWAVARSPTSSPSPRRAACSGCSWGRRRASCRKGLTGRQIEGHQYRGGWQRVTGDVKQTERKGLLRRKQRRVGEFEFRITLPREVDDDRIEANLAEGVLTVRVPKRETKARRVEVTEGS